MNNCNTILQEKKTFLKNNYIILLNKKNFFEKYIYLKTFLKNNYNEIYDTRFLNQQFYSSSRWKRIRRDVIVRDNGCDLGVPGLDIQGKIVVHHIDPITEEDIINDNPKLYDINNLICCSYSTHERLHKGLPPIDPNPIIRKEGDTKLW